MTTAPTLSRDELEALADGLTPGQREAINALLAENARLREALADIASVDNNFVEANGGDRPALERVVDRAAQALSPPEERNG